jgi:hypothetical protein
MNGMRARLPTPVLGVLLAAAASLPATFTLSPVVDPDTWWHLRAGGFVVDTHSVPETDPFSRLGREHQTPWLAYSWLYDLGLYEAYSVVGLTGIMLARTVLCAASAAVFLGFIVRRVGPTLVGGVAAILAAVVLMPFSRERPWHITIVLTVLTLDTVTRVREGERARLEWCLPAVFVLWANTHIQFVLGWLVLGSACVFPGRADRPRLVLLAVTCVLAVFVNPYHVRLLGIVWQYATETAPLRTVQELAPPEVLSVWTWATFGLLGWAAITASRRRPLDGFDVALLAVGFILSMRMRRDLWFGAATAVTVLRDAGVEPASRMREYWPPVLIAGVYLAVRLIHLAGFGPSCDFATAVADTCPKNAAQFVRERELPGPLFNPFDWGGYLIWELPEHPVSVDGRTNLYGSERIDRAMTTWVAGPGWGEDPDLIAANLVIAPRYRPLTKQLRSHTAEWAVAYEDETAVVFSRTRR